MSLKYFDVISYLLDRNIPYSTEGENIAQGWIGVSCPFCMTYDPLHHLGINLSSGGISCWRCTTTGTMLKYIMKKEHMGLNAARDITQQYANFGVGEGVIRETLDETAHIDIAKETQGSREIWKLYAEYLEGRGFNPHDIADKYNLWFGGITGHWKFRIIIPMMMDGKVVSFTGRAIGNKINPRYLNLNIQKSIVPVKKALYNIDNAGDSVIVVEGPTDVWRIGDGAVAIMGTKYCERQVKELMKFRNVFVMLDNEPQTVPIAEQLAADLSTCCNYVEIINIPEMTDPGELSNEDVRSLRSQLFKKIY